MANSNDQIDQGLKQRSDPLTMKIRSPTDLLLLGGSRVTFAGQLSSHLEVLIFSLVKDEDNSFISIWKAACASSLPTFLQGSCAELQELSEIENNCMTKEAHKISSMGT